MLLLYIDFMTSDVIQLLLNAKVTFSQGGATDLQKQSFGSRTIEADIQIVLGSLQEQQYE